MDFILDEEYTQTSMNKNSSTGKRVLSSRTKGSMFFLKVSRFEVYNTDNTAIPIFHAVMMTLVLLERCNFSFHTLLSTGVQNFHRSYKILPQHYEQCSQKLWRVCPDLDLLLLLLLMKVYLMVPLVCRLFLMWTSQSVL